MAKLAEEFTYDFSQGMYDSVAPNRYPSGSCALIENGRIQADGTVRRRWGSKRSSSGPVSYLPGICYGAMLFSPADKEDQLCAFIGSDFWVSEDWGVSWYPKATGLREQHYSLCTMRVGAVSYLFAANQDTTIKKWDGTTFSTVTGAPSGAKFVATFNNRLYVTGYQGVFVAASEIANPDNFTTPRGILLQVGTHDFEDNTGLFQIGDHLLVFKKNSTSMIDGFGEQTLIVAEGARGFSRSIGCIAFRTVCNIGDVGVAWVSLRGVEYYTPGQAINLVTRSVDEFMDQIDWQAVYTYPETMCAAYDSKEQNYVLAMSTNGIQNNRMLVLNIRENVLDQRRGKVVAASYDKLQGVAVNEYTFDNDGEGYFAIDSGGQEVKADVDGYMALAGVGVAGHPTEDSVDGYLVTALTDYMPTAIFTAPTEGNPTAIWTLGYDGYCRVHWGVDKDDTYYTGGDGVEVYMTVISKPFLMKLPRNRKKARQLHIASLQESSATIQVRVRAGGTTSAFKTLTMDALGLDSASRKRTGVSLIGDAPQVEIKTKDDVRVSLIGLSAEVLREAV